MAKRIIQLLVCLLCILPALAQTKTNAKITYKVSVESVATQEENSILTTYVDTYISPEGVIIKMDKGWTDMMGYILTLKSGTYSIYDDQKRIMQTEAYNKSQGTYEKLNETKIILGYTCTKHKKTIVDSSGQQSISYLWITNDITYPQIPGYENKSGVELLTTTTESNGIISKMEAVEISTRKLKLKLFKLPKGYTVIEIPKE